MANPDLQQIRSHIQAFDFDTLFIEALGWSYPDVSHGRVGESASLTGLDLRCQYIAEMGGAVAICFDGEIPNPALRKKIHREIEKLHHEHLLIFVDDVETPKACVYSWVKRDGNKRHLRTHHYMKGQPGDLLAGKLSNLSVDIADLDKEGRMHVTDVAERLQRSLDTEHVTKRFYNQFQEQHGKFLEYIEGIGNARDRQWYASVLLNRLMFIWFLQKKGFVDGNVNYLKDQLARSKSSGADHYYSEFLQLLFFEGFAKPFENRSEKAKRRLGKIQYLNGGLFVPHQIEGRWENIRIPDIAFEGPFNLFDKYSWHLDDSPGGNDNEINPDVLGYIFEKYINQKAMGAYYTCTEITDYLCEQTIHPLILERVKSLYQVGQKSGAPSPEIFDSLPDMLMHLDAGLCRHLIMDGGILKQLAILDPACGSGAFLVAAMKTLINVYSAVIGRIEILNDSALTEWLEKFRSEHPSIAYGIKKLIVTHNLFGVDIMEEAGEICKLRLFLALVASAVKEEDLEPLPNIDFNILSGNSLVGLLRVAEEEFAGKQGHLFQKPYREAVAEYERKVQTYRSTTDYRENLGSLRDGIDKLRCETAEVLDDILLDKFVLEEKDRQGRPKKIQYEQANWNEVAGKPGKSRKRPLKQQDITALKPFHWGFHFNRVLNERGGFDIILTNPPWETFKPNGKEFFEQHSDIVTKKRMSIKHFERHRRTLMQTPDIRGAWLKYQSSYPHQSQWFRVAEQYQRQFSAQADGKKVGSDINLYKLFLEQCHNLLCDGGECGIVIPSGIYTDLGAKGLREMLFAETQIGGLFGFENRKMIFDNVDSRFKFVVLTFRKGGVTRQFPVAFMRHDVKELADFPRQATVEMPVDLISKLSSDSLSLMEFKSKTDRKIVEKMLCFPLLGEQIEGAWNIRFRAEFHMTNDSRLFHAENAPGRLPLYEGKMIHQFNHQFAQSELRYWIDEQEGRASLLGRTEDTGQKLDYRNCRFGVRAIARNTDERTLIAGPVPRNAFCGNSILVAQTAPEINPPSEVEMIMVQAILNSYVVDYFLRMKVSANINMFYLYQLPIPRLTEESPDFSPIAKRAARLICTTPEFDNLAKQAGIKNHTQSATNESTRQTLRAEIDALVAHLYNLNESQFFHILDTFPLVPKPQIAATRDAYRLAKNGQIT